MGAAGPLDNFLTLGNSFLPEVVKRKHFHFAFMKETQRSFD